MWWLFTKKVRRHPTIEPGETVYQACYGLGSGIVQFANRSISPTADTWATPEADEGLAAPLKRSGVVALTDHRLLYFAKRFALGKPGRLTAEWPLTDIDDIGYDDDTLTIRFTDESAAQLHVPGNQSPDNLVSAWQSLASKPLT